MLHFLRIWGHFLSTVSVSVTPFSWSLRVYSFCISLFSFKSIWEGDSCGFYHSYFSLKPLIYILRRLVLVLCRNWGKNRILQGHPLGDRDISQQAGSRAKLRRLCRRNWQRRARKEPACFSASSELESSVYGQADGSLCLYSWRCKRDLSKTVVVLSAHF